MSMTKKDYELVAGVIREVNATLDRIPEGLRGEAFTTPEATVQTVANALGVAFQKDNVNFRIDRFMEAL